MVTIKSLHVEGLNGRLNYDLQFDERLNILTGRNGSGKTSILKLLWYIVSGRLDLIKNEIPFTKIEVHLSNEYSVKFDSLDFENRENEIMKANKYKIWNSFSSSYFFPTFRLVEGGFGIGENNISFHDRQYQLLSTLGVDVYISNNLKHRLIFQISSGEVYVLLLQKYAEIKSLLEHQFKIWDDELDGQLRLVEGEGEKEANLFRENRDGKRAYEAEMMHPFTTLNNLIAKFYQDKGIQITQGIVLGSKEYVELAENLSSGEKQMLTFLAYSLFTKDSIIFIDEPEISLHPDWQTDLIPTLMSQNNGNQYFIATHSPFIYADYLEYDINLDELRTANSVNQAVHE